MIEHNVRRLTNWIYAEVFQLDTRKKVFDEHNQVER